MTAISSSLTLAAKKQVGRSVRLLINGEVLAVCRTKVLTIENTLVNVTSDNDDGVQRLLTEQSEKRVGFSVDGVFSTDMSITNPLNDSVMEGVVLDFGDMTIAGTFKKISYTENKAHNDAISFTAQYMSSRAVVKS